MLGFDGYGGLKHCTYTISGDSTPEMNLEIIRLTSKYPQRNPQCLPMERDEWKIKEKAHIIPTPTSYLIPDFEFLVQSWFEVRGKVGVMWSYPSGIIAHEGTITESNISVASITTELCYLSQFFKGLTLEIEVNAPVGSFERRSIFKHIFFELRHGKVRVGFNNRNGNSFPHNNDQEEAEYNRLLCEGKPLFDRRTIEYISTANQLERERYEKDESKARLYELLNTNAVRCGKALYEHSSRLDSRTGPWVFPCASAGNIPV